MNLKSMAADMLAEAERLEREAKALRAAAKSLTTGTTKTTDRSK